MRRVRQMYIYYGAGTGPEEQEELYRKVEAQYGSSRPSMVWTDGAAGDGLLSYPLYMEGDVLARDVFLPLGQYLLTLHKGARILEDHPQGHTVRCSLGDVPADIQGCGACSRSECTPLPYSTQCYRTGYIQGDDTCNGGECTPPGYSTRICIEGGFTYSRGGYSWEGKSVSVDPEGCLTFGITIRSMEELDMGLCYHGVHFDQKTKRDVISRLYSPFCKLPEETDVEISFYPAVSGNDTSDAGRNKVRFQKECTLETYFTSIYAEPVTMYFDRDFSFVLSQRADVNGYPVCYYAPEGKARARGGKKLMPGLSGAEYIQLEENAGIEFLAGQRAYFDPKKIQAQPTTSYISAEGAVYFTQPQLSDFFEDKAETICAYTDLPGVRMKSAAFPAFPYADDTEGNYGVEMAVYIENTYLSQVRQEQIAAVIPRDGEDCAFFCRNPLVQTFAVTRHGMKAAMEGDRLLWLRVAFVDGMEPGIAFTNLNPSFYLGLLSNSLFAVFNSLEGYASTPFVVTEARLSIAGAKGYGEGGKLAGLVGHTYPDRKSFTEAVKGQEAGVDDRILEACQSFNISIAGWRFLMSPDRWKENGTVFLTKLSMEHSVSELITMEDSWSIRPEAEAVRKIQKQMESLEKQSKLPGFEVLDGILHDRDWRGTVFFSAAVDLAAIPQELQFLANGIDRTKFRAAYVAFPAAGADESGQASVNALIAYEDSVHLNFEDEREFGFKVLSLRLEIKNGVTGSFRAKVELLVNRLFGSRCRGYGSDTGSNIVFDGGYQEHDGGGFYSFVIASPQSYALSESAVTDLMVGEASLQAGVEEYQFVLGGSIALLEHPGMDLFSYDRIAFRGFTISMRPKGGEYEFAPHAESFCLCQDESVCRSSSLAATFPLKTAGIVEMAARSITECGYSPLKIRNGTDEAEFGKDWMGMVWELETGNLGGLAASTNLTLKILTAWNSAPDSKDPDSSVLRVAAGIAVSTNGAQNDWALPLQGIITLGFDAIELHYEEDFYFKFRNFSVNILGKRFPDTNNDMYLTGDGEGNLGWYGTL